MTETAGTRIGSECFDSLPASAKLKCLRDQIVIEPIPWPFSDIIEVVYEGKPLRGIVKAVGPGHYRKIYNGPKGKRTKSWDSKYFTPCDVKIGDVVQIGGLEIRGYLFQTFRWGGKEMVICRENDITAIET
jgi:co-chaperonin GroES (HSP10)